MVRPTPPVLVVGGGVIGLSAGVRLLEAGFAVELRAREPAEACVSGVAAALWYPYHARPVDRVRRWGALAWRQFVLLAEDPATGVRLLEGLELGPAAEELTWTEPGGPSAREARPEELPAGQVRGVVWRLPVIEMPVYLPWLRARFQALGGRLIQAEVGSLDEALAEFPVAVNATGLGARELAHDLEVFAIRGQVVSLARRGGERVLVDDRDPEGLTYVVPRSGDLVLGGVAEEGVEELEVDDAQTRGILARCAALDPALARREVLGVRVGLRPGRSTVRLETEQRASGLVVHDYGHGGAGVTLSWGCADEVAGLVARHARG
jgi:D-amino-acid oxidase